MGCISGGCGMEQTKRLPGRDPDKSSSLKERLTKDGVLEKAIERTYKRRNQRRGSPPRSGQYRLPIDLNHPDFLYDTIWEIALDKIALEEERALDRERIDDEDRTRYKARKPLIREIKKQLERAQSDLRDSYPAEFSARTEWATPKWLRPDSKEKERKKKKKLTKKEKTWKRLQRYHFEEIYFHLTENILPNTKKTRELIKKAGGQTWSDNYPDYPGQRLDIILDPDWDRQGLADKLDLSIKTLMRYIKALERIGILIPLPQRIGQGGRKIYTMGYRTSWKDPETGEGGPTGINWHLKESPEIKDALASFTISKT
jgi:hypothetical protein